MNRWRRTNVPRPEQRVERFHERLGVSEEELLRRQALGLRVRATRPPYPVGEVVGPCVCGSWPGGECLKCEWLPIADPRHTCHAEWAQAAAEQLRAFAAEALADCDELFDRATADVLWDRKRGGDLLLSDLDEEGFFITNLRDVIEAGKPNARTDNQANACHVMRDMFQRVHEKLICERADELIAEAVEKSRRDAAEYAALCREEA